MICVRCGRTLDRTEELLGLERCLVWRPCLHRFLMRHEQRSLVPARLIVSPTVALYYKSVVG